MVRRISLIAGLVWVILVAAVWQQPTSAQADANQFQSDVLNMLNRWRMEQGLWPLKWNDTLYQMAESQAEYVQSLPAIPQGGAIHDGPNGETPLERALLAPYSWPTYGRSDAIVVGEIAAVGSPNFAMNFWKTSDIHARTALNPNYREVGIAALPRNTDYLFIVVLGGRPDVLPSVVQNGELFLSNERFNAGGNWIGSATQIRLFDSSGRPLTADWVEWQPRLPIPSDAGDKLFVLYSDGTRQVLSEVSLIGQIPTSPVTVAQAPTATPAPTAVPSTPTPVVDTSSVVPDVVVLYDASSLTVLNVSPTSLDLSAFDLGGGGVDVPFTRWTSVTDLNLSDFPAGHCVQIKATGQDGEVTMPAGCRWLRSIITLNPVQFFWLGVNFDVRQNGQVIATCQPGRPECKVDLPN